VAERVDIRNVDARAMPFGDQTFDVIVSSLMLHHAGGGGPPLLNSKCKHLILMTRATDTFSEALLRCEPC